MRARINRMSFVTGSSDVQAEIPALSQPPRIRPAPEGFAGPSEEAVPNDYDSFAEAYSAQNETSLFNAYYERPAMLDLAGDVAGRRIPGRRLRLRPPVRGTARP
jgi:hypothetical protein